MQLAVIAYPKSGVDWSAAEDRLAEISATWDEFVDAVFDDEELLSALSRVGAPVLCFANEASPSETDRNGIEHALATSLGAARSVERVTGLTTLSSDENAVLIASESEVHRAVVALDAVGALDDTGIRIVDHAHYALTDAVSDS